jgi:hypothetical protein
MPICQRVQGLKQVLALLGSPEGHRPFGGSRAEPWWGFGGEAPEYWEGSGKGMVGLPDGGSGAEPPLSLTHMGFAPEPMNGYTRP